MAFGHRTPKMVRYPSRCADCTTPIMVAYNRVGRNDNLCDDCRANREKRRRAEVREKEVKVDQKRNQTWKVIKDPDDTWGYNSVLSHQEIVDLSLRRGYLANGTTFRDQASGTVVCMIGGRLQELHG